MRHRLPSYQSIPWSINHRSKCQSIILRIIWSTAVTVTLRLRLPLYFCSTKLFCQPAYQVFPLECVLFLNIPLIQVRVMLYKTIHSFRCCYLNRGRELLYPSKLNSLINNWWEIPFWFEFSNSNDIWGFWERL